MRRSMARNRINLGSKRRCGLLQQGLWTKPYKRRACRAPQDSTKAPNTYLQYRTPISASRWSVIDHRSYRRRTRRAAGSRWLISASLVSFQAKGVRRATTWARPSRWLMLGTTSAGHLRTGRERALPSWSIRFRIGCKRDPLSFEIDKKFCGCK